MARYMWRLLTLVLVVIALVASFLSPAAAQEGRHVNVARLSGVVDPIMAQYMTRAINTSVNDGAHALVIEMDTPGGLDSSMRKIISQMLAAPIPIIVYVAPAGARAGSAGVFITMAANVAAMAPSTNIGSAHPVGGQGEDIAGDLGDKVVNDAAAYIRTIAEKRGRNAEWAEQAVRKSVNITEKEAVQQNVVEFVATDVRALLDAIDGRQVTTATGNVTLQTASIGIRRVDMNIQEELLHVLTNPTLAYLLLTIGIYALIAEFNNPGAIFPGVVGAICLILAFISFESLPINVGGIALIVLAVGLFIAEIKVASSGILTAGGIITFLLGSLMLFSPLTPAAPSMPTNVSVPWPWILIMTGLTTLVFTFVVGAGLRAQRARVTVGGDTTLAAQGIAKTDLAPNGVVLIHSEEWTAAAVEGPIKKGDPVWVVSRDGLMLRVKAPEPTPE